MASLSRAKSTKSDGAIYAASLLALGGTVVGLAMRNLSMDDPRWTHNAWTYIYGVPIGIVLISIISQAFAAKWVERTLQAAFLLSLAAHLVLASEASNLIVLGLPSSDKKTSGSQSTKEENQSEKNYSSVSYQPKFDHQSNESIASAITRSQLQDSKVMDTTFDNALSSQDAFVPEVSPLEKQLQLQQQSPSQFELERQQAEAQQAEIQSRAIELERTEADIEGEPNPSQSTAIAVPEQSVEPEANPLQESQALPRDLTDSRPSQAFSPEIAQSQTNQSPRGPSGFEPNVRPRDTSIPMNQVRPTNDARQRELAGSLEVQMRDRAKAFAAMPKSSNIGSALSPSDMLLGSNSIQLPGPDASGAGDTLPNTDVSSLGLDRPGRSRDDVSGELSGQAELSQSGMARNARGSLGTQSSSGVLGPSTALLGPRGTELQPRSLGGSQGIAKLEASAGSLPEQIGQNRAIELNRALPSGGNPMVSAVPTAAFARRADRNNAESQDADLGQWGPQTEAAIEAGLKFLAKYQRADGSWSLEDFGDRPLFASDTAATALSLLAFQGAGYSHLQYQYQETCRRAIDFLVSNQQPNGDLYIPMNELSDRNSRFYSHGIAALALCEAFGMTQDEALRVPAQRSIDFLLTTQDPLRGGWRYTPQAESDTSVTGWCMMAMKSAELAGLQVDREAYRKIEGFLDRSQASPDQAYLYRYNYAAADSPQTRHGLQATPTMTGVGLLLRLYLGWRRDNQNMIRGADYLLQSIPEMGTVQDPKRDTYYWYYATQVMFHMGGEHWKRWNTALHPMLIKTQLQRGEYAGSWDAGGAIPDRWGSFAGRLYVTTLNLLSLEVYYRHLPIYEETAK